MLLASKCYVLLVCAQRWLLIAILVSVGVLGGREVAHAAPFEFIVFTADTDNTGGSNPVGAPADSHPRLPSISPGVTLNPSVAKLGGVETGPLNGVVYGPTAYGGNTGGTTGWVNVSFVIPVGGYLQFVFEVADVGDTIIHSSLAIDNIRLNGQLLFSFEGGLPPGFVGLGSYGVSGAVTNLAPTEGDSFGFIDTSWGVLPLFDPVEGTEASRFVFFHEPPSPFTIVVKPGDVLTMDLAFLTNDGGIYRDYAIVQVKITPEPSAAFALGLGIIGLVVWRRRIQSLG